MKTIPHEWDGLLYLEARTNPYLFVDFQEHNVELSLANHPILVHVSPIKSLASSDEAGQGGIYGHGNIGFVSITTPSRMLAFRTMFSNHLEFVQRLVIFWTMGCKALSIFLRMGSSFCLSAILLL